MTNTQDTTALVERLKEALRGDYTDRGMEDVFIRWPVVERELIAALSAPQQPLGDVEAVREVLSRWRPIEMTAETAPHWLKELSPEEYARRRNDENAEALRLLNFFGDWLSYAASCLHSSGALSGSEFGSYGHSCFILSDALVGVREDVLNALQNRALTTPVAEQPPSFTPDGMVLVPRDPTDAMLSALEGVDYTNESERAIGCNLWYTMLNAAPKAQPSHQIEALTADNARLREACLAWVKYDESDMSDVETKFAYVEAIETTRAALIQTKDNDDALPE